MLKENFKKYLEEAIGSDNALVAFSAFDTQASVAIRKNPFKKCPEYAGTPVPWSSYGLMLDERPIFTLDPAFHSGAYYVQDSSSMFVGSILRRFLPEVSAGKTLKVLDLCAAPGGKTTDIAASLRAVFGDSFLLVANEVMKQRSGVLADNVALWGDPNVVVTNDDPKAFAGLEGFFDVIVADVPCSGEGMFRKDEEAVAQWSEDNVSLCASRQKRIVADVWNSLDDGGLFIYSTCTFNRYENDMNVEWIISELGAEALTAGEKGSLDGILDTSYGYSLVPGLVKGEGQYCAALRKVKREAVSCSAYPAFRPSRPALKKDPALNILFGLFSSDMVFKKKNETYIAVPASIDAPVSVIESCLHIVSEGCAAGMMKGTNFIPDADMALCIKLSENAFPRVQLDRKTALTFLRKDSITLPEAPKGYLLVEYGGIPLGFVKNIGNRCNNLHPQSRRIRMDVNNI